MLELPLRYPYLSPWIQTTNRCNLSCHYCYVKQDSSDMQTETYQRIASLIKVAASHVENLSVRIAGGEPLLVFNNWANAFDELLSINNIRLDVLTNGILIKDRFLSWLKERNTKAYVSVSVDGLSGQKSLSKSRVPELVKLNIRPHIMTVITPEQIGELPELADFILGNGLSWRISLDHFYKGNPIALAIEKSLLSVVNKINNYGYDHDNIQFENCGTYKRFGCCAGRYLFAIDVNGGIHACHTLIDKEVPLGSVWNTTNLISVLSPILPGQCDCALYYCCNGGCPLYNEHTRQEITCGLNKIFTLALIESNIKAKEAQYAKL